MEDEAESTSGVTTEAEMTAYNLAKVLLPSIRATQASLYLLPRRGF